MRAGEWLDAQVARFARHQDARAAGGERLPEFRIRHVPAKRERNELAAEERKQECGPDRIVADLHRDDGALRPCGEAFLELLRFAFDLRKAPQHASVCGEHGGTFGTPGERFMPGKKQDVVGGMVSQGDGPFFLIAGCSATATFVAPKFKP